MDRHSKLNLQGKIKRDGRCFSDGTRRLFSREWPAGEVLPASPGNQVMDPIQSIAALLTVGMFVYLLFAMLFPERFS